MWSWNPNSWVLGFPRRQSLPLKFDNMRERGSLRSARLSLEVACGAFCLLSLASVIASLNHLNTARNFADAGYVPEAMDSMSVAWLWIIVTGALVMAALAALVFSRRWRTPAGEEMS
ncbi:hypothetical protein Cfla_0084 [Cellulomonas flavigena DSM 20109]|uniref:Uncharacterized protein n=1 Tax=Cellulomonas flavigena (strain ATCC 482 / DSM 20109 / BCRC 11376 / JCM 18109 / NBRC 3775 / NCIMB 8073 / NRS 134) TaxID=446466 RepID=D5UFP5_CELFN|nr:hypothetical protein Cfla_0084 [Cellulomonas flavigena DSM 20109]